MVEMAMMMNGYDLDYEKEGVGPSRIPTPEEVRDDYMPQDFEHTNEVYTVNGRAFDYMDHPIHVKGVLTTASTWSTCWSLTR